MITSDKTILYKYMPSDAVENVCLLLEKYPVQLKITNPRKRIHGSYRRPGRQSNLHQITVNGDLNKYTFLLTLLHEIAHMHAWTNYKARSHGKEWKYCFMLLIKQFLALNIFPDDIKTALSRHLQNIKSSDFMDVQLTKTLQKYNENTLSFHHTIHLEEIPENTVFLHEGKCMEKQKLLRKYYLCKDLKTKKMYRCHPLLEVCLPQKDKNE
ncbi:MAG: SprT-like domain-containing protein [Bacteroidales bacterium]|nr:SprT-like domain-containing protein [Bacteroidales bacterium]